jgi:NADPH-dependent ferric siderophore reductase
MTAGRPKLQLWRGDEIAVEVELDSQQDNHARLVIGEADRISFELSPREPGQVYEIRIGDFPLPKSHHGRASVEWADDVHFDSARGRTPVTVVSHEVDGPDGRWVARARAAPER